MMELGFWANLPTSRHLSVDHHDVSFSKVKILAGQRVLVHDSIFRFIWFGEKTGCKCLFVFPPLFSGDTLELTGWVIERRQDAGSES
jgi:hypothetical protein